MTQQLSVKDVLKAFQGMSLDELAAHIEKMPADARKQIDDLATEVVGDKLWWPNPGPQTDAYFCEADELFFGGSAGPGKSSLLCGLACNEHSRSTLFRREAAQVHGLIDEVESIVGSRNGFNGQDKIWRLDDGKIIQFAGVQYEDDVKKHQGRAKDFIGFDEITEFGERQFRFLIGWNRPGPGVDPAQRCRVVAAGNPPTTEEGTWVLRYWAPWLDENHPNPAKPGELRWFTTIDGRDVECPNGDPIEVEGRMVRPRSRTFIQAFLEDNPDLMKTNYASVLEAMPEDLRLRFRDGVFTTKFEDDAFQVIPSAWVKAAQQRWLEGKRPDTPMTSVGVDVALGGKDDLVIAPRYGNWIDPLDVTPGKELRGEDGEVRPAMVAMHVARVRKNGAQVNLDSVGVGASLQMHCQDNDIPHASLNAARGTDAKDSTNTYGFSNCRTEWWWKFRQRLDPEHGDGHGKPSTWALPPDPLLAADLTAPRYELRAGKYALETKEKIFERLGRSTDRGDAVVMAAYTGDQQAAFRARGGTAGIRINRAHQKLKRR